jgi:hypothetical protein
MRGFMMVSIGRMVILGWISFISMEPPSGTALLDFGAPA